MNKKNVVARLTAIREIGVRTIIEVHDDDDTTFSTFFHYYTQVGLKRSTKTQIRVANRNDGLHPWYRAYRIQPGLEALAEHWKKMPQITSVRVRIIKKRAYRRLLEAAPDVLGLVKDRAQFSHEQPIAVDLGLSQSFVIVAKKSRARLTYGMR